jgi:hypothetical protein
VAARAASRVIAPASALWLTAAVTAVVAAALARSGGRDAA